jgi:hypothetical protein
VLSQEKVSMIEGCSRQSDQQFATRKRWLWYWSLDKRIVDLAGLAGLTVDLIEKYSFGHCGGYL